MRPSRSLVSAGLAPVLVALAMLCVVGGVTGQAPASIAGKTFGIEVTSGTGPFASYGYFLLLPASSGNSYQVIGVRNVTNSNGHYSYTAAGSSGTLNLTDITVGSIAGNFTFNSASSGTYQLAAGGFSQSGQFEMYSASVPSTIGGQTYQCAVTNGGPPFASAGSFTLAVAASGSSYSITGDGVNTVNSSGNCSYSVVNTTTGAIQINDSAVGNATIYVGMSDASTGGYAITAASGGFQVGHFTSANPTGQPSITITSPTTTATYSTSSSSLDLGGSATDNVPITQVTWTNSLGGGGTANGTTAWSVAGIPLQNGTNVITVKAVDNTGQFAETTLTVQAIFAPVTITSPTTNSTYSTTSRSIDLGGTASATTAAVWWSGALGSGTANGTTTWTVVGIALRSGWNVITVTSGDHDGHYAQAVLTVFCDLSVYTPYTFSTLAGSPGSPGAVDGTSNSARFEHPCGVAVDSAGNLYVADTDNNTIRKITSAGAVSTLAGTPGVAGNTDGVGSVALFWSPWGVAVDKAGNVYVTDSGNSTIRKITPNGVVSTLAGLPGETGFADGTGDAALFNFLQGIAVDSSGNVYVADCYNNAIRKITPGGVVSTLAGSPGNVGNADGPVTAAGFSDPMGVAVDNAGNVYVTQNGTIRKITPDGMVSTVAGCPTCSGDGLAGAAGFASPHGVAVDDAGNLYVAESGANTIRKVTSAGMVTTLAGSSGLSGFANGASRSVRFSWPTALAVDSAGNIYVADNGNSTIRKGWPFGTGPDAKTQICVSQVGQSTLVDVPTINGCTYQLQASSSLTSPAWSNMGAPQIGYGNLLTFTIGATGAPQRFYRVQFTAP